MVHFEVLTRLTGKRKLYYESIQSRLVAAGSSVEALATAASIATSVVAGLVVSAAFRTFNLRSRIDYAAEWGKRAQCPLDLSLGDNQDGQLLGIKVGRLDW